MSRFEGGPQVTTPQPEDIYLNFILLAVVGKMGEADGLFERFPGVIEGVARMLRTRTPPPRRPLYRGLLLDPREVATGHLSADERRFLSFTEDRDLALWFAHPCSIMSSFMVEAEPHKRPYLAERGASAPTDDIIFHYTWVPGIERAVGMSMYDLTEMHPQVDAEQLAWNLRTQREAIVLPPMKLTVKPLAADELPSAEDLDMRYCAPRFR